MQKNTMSSTTATTTMLSHHQSTSVPRRAVASSPLHEMLSMSNNEVVDARFQYALEQIENLRKDPTNIAIDEALSARLERESDPSSLFALLSGQIGFWPTSFVGSAVPLFAIRHPKYAHIPDLFQFLLQGEVLGASLLLLGHQDQDQDQAPYYTATNDDDPVIIEDDITSLFPPPFKISPLAQAFPMYADRMAVSQKRAACAAACAVVFPRWARICQRLLKATTFKNEEEQESGSSSSTAALLDFFSTSVQEIDEMAAAIMMMQEDLFKSCTYQDMSNHVKVLQEYEMLFWDVCDIVVAASPEHCSTAAATASRPKTTPRRRSSFARTA